MDLTFQDPGLEYSLAHILDFQAEGMSDYWRDGLFLFYPQLDRAHFDALEAGARPAYLREGLGAVYRENQALIGEKRAAYQACWKENRPQVEEAFSDAFGLDTRVLFNGLTVNITLNPICPRYLEEHAFDLFYLNSPQGALGMSLHEMTHFLWFHLWQNRFGDTPAEYESPSLKWVFSEMAAAPILGDGRLSALNPYRDGCVYDYFYTMTVEGTPVLDTMGQMYRSLPIGEFMEQGYAWCLRHEGEIRGQMR